MPHTRDPAVAVYHVCRSDGMDHVPDRRRVGFPEILRGHVRPAETGVCPVRAGILSEPEACVRPDRRLPGLRSLEGSAERETARDPERIRQRGCGAGEKSGSHPAVYPQLPVHSEQHV